MLLIELDFDGVFYNLNQKVLDTVNKQFKTKYTERDVIHYGYDNFPKEIRSFIFELFKSPKILTDKKYMYPDYKDALLAFNDFAAEDNVKVLLRTLVKTKECQEARKDFIISILEDVNVSNINLSVVLTKNEIKCDVLVEDNPKALTRKTDGLVIARKQPYNIHLKNKNHDIVFANNAHGAYRKVKKLISTLV